MGTRENLLEVRERIRLAKRNAPDPGEPVLLVGVTKGVAPDRIREAVDAGLTAFGENRVQEAREKVGQFKETVRWHMVGHLQRNKAKEAVRLFHLIHSVDTLPLAEALEKEAALLGKEIPVLLQVKFQEKETRSGVLPEDLLTLAKEVAPLAHLKLSGLMMIAPLGEAEVARPYFRELRLLKESFEKEQIPGAAMRILSMGMTNDFEVAIEEGANLLRIGRGIFGSTK